MKKSLYQHIEDVSENLELQTDMMEDQDESQAIYLLNQVIIQDQLASIEMAQSQSLLQNIEGGY